MTHAEPAGHIASWKLDGDVIGLSITDVGRQAIGQPNEDPAPATGVASATATDAVTATNATALRAEPSVALPEREPLADAVAALRTTLGPTPRPASQSRAPRQGTK